MSQLAFPDPFDPFGIAPVEVTRDMVVEARLRCRDSGRRLLEELQEVSGLSPEDFLPALAHALRYPSITLYEMHVLSPALDLISYSESLQHQCVGFRDAENNLLLAFSDPFDDDFLTWIDERLRLPYIAYLAHRDDIVAFLASYEETQSAMDSVLGGENADHEHGEQIQDISLRSISADTNPVVKLVNSTLYDALKSGVSDIHLENSASGLAIKYRIDGVLSSVGSVPGTELAEQVVSRLKVMSELDISERRVPQDGRFKVLMSGREVDFRVSIMPGMFGEDAVLRVLDKQAMAESAKGLRLEITGLDQQSIAMLRKMANEPYGMVLVTGPTGSGKTTTLYASLSEINHGQDKIITIEDPVEYQLPGVLQIPVNEKKGLTFSKGLRSILRHDPDKIMVGEIRDGDTAQIAVQAALTGHLVFTTVHANNVFDVIGRFTHMGVDPYSFVSALNGILAQRLVRLVCPFCAEVYNPDPQLLLDSGLPPSAIFNYNFRTGRGCGQCRGSGYKGRMAIAEVLHMNDELRELIIARAPISQLKAAARKHGARFLRESALAAVQEGRTTLQEINRVTFVD